MPELKNTFTGGKMEKDLDERIVPSGQYREALNISVATSEDSDVGAAQNILGNIKVTEAIQSRTMTMGEEYAGDNYHVAEVINPLTDMLYRFIHTASPIDRGRDENGNPLPPGEGIWMDRIVEFDTQATLDTPVDGGPIVKVSFTVKLRVSLLASVLDSVNVAFNVAIIYLFFINFFSTLPSL